MQTMTRPRRLLLPLLLLVGTLHSAGGIYFFSREMPVPLPQALEREAGLEMAPCVCSLAEWCAPLRTPKEDLSEVFAFVLNTTEAVWRTFDWKKLTTVVLFDFLDPELLCWAHKHNVRVLQNANFLKANVTNATYRAEWVARHVNYTRRHYLDGINVDFEEPIGAKDPARRAFVQLMNETRRQLDKHAVNPKALLTVDVPWSPDCIDGRCYDFVGLRNFTDMFFVMGYDQRSQVFAKNCIAGANSPLNQTLAGVRKYMAMGVPASKIVLGVPWYGYDYYCLNITHNGTVCEIERVPFRGANCSDDAGKERQFSELASWQPYVFQRFWSEAAQSPFFNVQFEGWNFTHQVWFDNTTSLTYKYMGAASLKLRGLGIWAANFLASGNSTHDKAQRNSMWGALARWNWQAEPPMTTLGGPASISDGIKLQYKAKGADHRAPVLKLLRRIWPGRWA